MKDIGYCDAQLRREKGATLLAYVQSPVDAHLAVVLVELEPGAKWVVWTYNREDGGFSSGDYFQSSLPGVPSTGKLVSAYRFFAERVYRLVHRL